MPEAFATYYVLFEWLAGGSLRKLAVGFIVASTSDKKQRLGDRVAQSVSDQIFNDSINSNAEAVYALASPELKKVQTEAQIAAGLQQLNQLIVSKPLLTRQASYPTSNEARFVYTLQTTQGAKQFILDLGLTDGQWLLYSAQLRK